jgi:two-component system OmpR family response regulator
MRVLIVEDDEALAAQMKQSLVDTGYSVDHAADGEDGHFLGDTEPYDAVILDLGLPIMDGASVLKRWRSDGREMPVLILTARDGWTDKVEGLDAGADDYLTKPFVMEELLGRAIEPAIDLRPRASGYPQRQGERGWPRGQADGAGIQALVVPHAP